MDRTKIRVVARLISSCYLYFFIFFLEKIAKSIDIIPYTVYNISIVKIKKGEIDMKYNVSKIMRRAWELKRKEDIKTRNNKWNRNDFSPLKDSEKALFGICLEMAWEEAKEVEEVKKAVKTGCKARIKEWFLSKKFGKEVSNFSDTIEILKETEKAVYGNVYHLNGIPMEIWCPKSCLC